jgi:hypothetical protein
MKYLIRILCGLVAVAGLVLFLYGAVKMYRASEETKPIAIKVDDPSIKAVTVEPSRADDGRGFATGVLLTGLVLLVGSIAGFVWVGWRFTSTA